MSKITLLFLFFGCILILNGCQDQEKIEALKLREDNLSKREAEFSSKLANYEELIKFRDSVLLDQEHKIDSLSFHWPDSIAGRWNAKILCVESNCGEYAVGDLRVDIWDFTKDSTNLVAKIYNNKSNSIIRTYQAKMLNNSIELSFETDSTAAKKVKMGVNLTEFGNNKIKGNRRVDITDKCTALFSVELTKAIPPQN